MEHLRDSDVAELLEGLLPPEHLAIAEEHADRCADCRALLAAAARAFGDGTDSAPVADEALPLARGANVGRYRILEPLGAGGMGLVYASYDSELDRRVALKILRPGAGGPPDELRARVQREAQALARLNHPNVTTIYEVGTFQGQLFFAMELVEGGTLRDWLLEKKRTVPEVIEVFLQAASGLAAAHRAAVVHRDFKPENVLVGKDGRVRVTDFGVARLGGREKEADGDRADLLPAVRASPNTSGRVMGSPAYMAPEQRAGKPTDARADVYSFCVTLYEALYGERPFAGRIFGEVGKTVADARDQAPRPRARVPAWPRSVLVRGLADDPEERLGSMDELVRELRRGPPRKRRMIAPAVAVAAVAAMTLASLGLRPAALRSLTASRDPSTLLSSPLGREARDSYLRGQFFARKPTAEALHKSALSFRRAVELDPSYAPAHAGLAAVDASLMTFAGGNTGEQLPEAEAAARKALALDETLVEAHVTLGFLSWYQYDWQTAQRELLRAIALDGGSALAHDYYSLVLAYQGRLAEAWTENERARQIDPGSLGINSHRAVLHAFARDYPKAIEEASKVLEIDAHYPIAIWSLLIAYSQTGRYAEALARITPRTDLENVTVGMLGYVLALSGQRQAARQALAATIERAQRGHDTASCVALIYVALSDKESAFQWLDRAYQERDYRLRFLKMFPGWDPLRADPRFGRLLGQVHFQ